MTRKDYVRLAAALKEARARGQDADPYAASHGGTEAERRAYGAGLSVGWGLALGEIADMLAADNPRFDRGRFYDAADGYGIMYPESDR